MFDNGSFLRRRKRFKRPKQLPYSGLNILNHYYYLILFLVPYDGLNMFMPYRLPPSGHGIHHPGISPFLNRSSAQAQAQVQFAAYHSAQMAQNLHKTSQVRFVRVDLEIN